MGKASAEYYNLEKVAEVLSVSAADVNRLREQGKLRGLRDGNTWKFFKEEVHTYLADKIKSRGGANGGHKPGDSGFDLQDISSSSSSSSSFDVLMEDAALPGDSDLVAVAPVRPASDLDLAALDQEDELSLAEETQISSLVVPKKSKPKEEINNVIIVEDDEDSSALLLAPSGTSDALGDEDSVLTPGGSSPQLNLTSDSGFDVLVAGEDESILLVDDEKTSVPDVPIQEFELEPSPKILDGDDSESSSQVIAIDAFAGLGPDVDPFAKQNDDFGAFSGFDDSGIQQPPQATTMGTEPFGASDVFSATAAPVVSVAPQKTVVPAEEYSTGTLITLMVALVVMLPAGLMLIDTMAHMWSWSEPFILNSVLMDTFSGLFGL